MFKLKVRGVSKYWDCTGTITHFTSEIMISKVVIWVYYLYVLLLLLICFFSADGYSIYVRSLPLTATPAQLEEEFKRFGAIKPGGIQVRSNKVCIHMLPN